MIDRRLHFVVATARYGSFTVAAERVGVTQSAVTRGVADLEKQLGFLLFNRTSRGVLLTDEGQYIAERAARLIDEAESLFRSALSGSDPYADVLKIGVCPPALQGVLTEPLSTLLSRHPKIRYEIDGTSYHRAVQQLRTGAIDVALGYEAAFSEQPDFQCSAMPTIAISLFVRLGHPLLDRSAVNVTDIGMFDLISPSNSAPYDFAFRQLYETAGVDIRERLHIVDYFPLVARLVSQTDAIGTVSTQYTTSPAFKRRFASLQLVEGSPVAQLCCATRLKWNPRPVVRAFVKACRERLDSAGGARGAGCVRVTDTAPI